jgi:transcriptional regulator with XRE-family HTH domain
VRKGVHPLLKQLRNERFKQKLTLTQIEDQIGHPEKAVRSWESGVHKPRFSAFIDYANGLGFEVTLVKRFTSPADAPKIDNAPVKDKADGQDQDR